MHGLATEVLARSAYRLDEVGRESFGSDRPFGGATVAAALPTLRSGSHSACVPWLEAEALADRLDAAGWRDDADRVRGAGTDGASIFTSEQAGHIVNALRRWRRDERGSRPGEALRTLEAWLSDDLAAAGAGDAVAGTG